MTRRGAGLLLAAAALLARAGAAPAAGFAVSPIRLDFDQGARTGAITVTNDEAERLSFQLSLRRWTQDAEGADQYADSKDLIYFPQVMTLEGKDKRIVRVGTRGPAPSTEQAYRLFIEEMPRPGTAAATGTQVAVRLRFGVPLFVAPAKPQLAGAIEDVGLEGGQVSLTVRNTGNRNFRFEKILAKAGDKALGEVSGWYLLAGAARRYHVALDPAACAQAKRIEVSLQADALQLRRELDAAPARCSR